MKRLRHGGIFFTKEELDILTTAYSVMYEYLDALPTDMQNVFERPEDYEIVEQCNELLRKAYKE